MSAQQILDLRPQAAFDSFPLDNAQLGPNARVVLNNPAERFCIDRFKLLTVHEQSKLLADIAIAHQSEHHAGRALPFEVQSIMARLNKGPDQVITHPEAVQYYLDHRPKALCLWLERAIKNEEMRGIVLERLFTKLSQELPAIAFTLAHIYSGGYHGLITAREDRDTLHAPQIEYISEQFGWAPQTELVYYVNDPVRGKRLHGRGMSTAIKKATVLTNFANGLKEDEEGRVVPMTIGRRFDEIIFIDDEDKNLKAVMHCLVRSVCVSVMDQIGMRFRTPAWEQGLNERAEAMTDKGFATHGITATSSLTFWVNIVDELLSNYTQHTGEYSDREKLIADLISNGRWMPDVVKVLDARTLPVEPSIERLRELFHLTAPIIAGERRSIVFNDIDRTILAVDAVLNLRRKGDPSGNPVYVISQAQFAEHSSEDYWFAKAAQEHGLLREELEMGWEHFRNGEMIRQDILAALYKGEIAKNPHQKSGH